jgi:anaphase-promoting complex subunit 5
LEHCLEYLKIAETDFESLEMYSSLQDVLYYKAMVLETLGRREERDAACEKHEQIQAQQQQLAALAVDREVSEICDAIVLIGTAISRR